MFGKDLLKVSAHLLDGTGALPRWRQTRTDIAQSRTSRRLV